MKNIGKKMRILIPINLVVYFLFGYINAEIKKPKEITIKIGEFAKGTCVLSLGLYCSAISLKAIPSLNNYSGTHKAFLLPLIPVMAASRLLIHFFPKYFPAQFDLSSVIIFYGILGYAFIRYGITKIYYSFKPTETSILHLTPKKYAIH